GLAVAVIIDARGGNVLVPEPFLDLGDVGLVRQGVRGGRGAHGMDTQPVDLGIEAGVAAILDNDVVLDEPGWFLCRVPVRLFLIGRKRGASKSSLCSPPPCFASSARYSPMSRCASGCIGM